MGRFDKWNGTLVGAEGFLDKKTGGIRSCDSCGKSGSGYWYYKKIGGQISPLVCGDCYYDPYQKSPKGPRKSSAPTVVSEFVWGNGASVTEGRLPQFIDEPNGLRSIKYSPNKTVLYSYGAPIAERHSKKNGIKIVIFDFRGSNALSRTTTKHVNMALNRAVVAHEKGILSVRLQEPDPEIFERAQDGIRKWKVVRALGGQS